MKLVLNLLFLLLFVGARASAQTSFVTIDGGNTVDLCASCLNPQIRITVTPTTPKFRPTEDPIVSEVSVGTLRDSSLRDAFKAKWEKGKDNYPIALLVDVVEPKKVAKAATYAVVLNLLPTSEPDAPRLTIQVQHPAAQLQVPSKLIVHRILGFADDKQDLYVAETLGKSAITDVQISPALQPSLLGDVPVTGQLRLTDLAKVEPGKASKVNYDLTGSFPLGTVTGAMQITAPQLTQAVPLNFEVRSRLPLPMIFVYALAGALVSWLLKVVLQGRIELNEARIKARDLLQRVNADRNKHADTTFRAAIDMAIADLEKSYAGSSAADIERDRQTLDQKWREALKELATRREAVQKTFDDWRSVTDNAWQVPKLVAAQVELGKKDLDKIAAELANDDLINAATDLTSVQGNLGLHVKGAAIEWQLAMSNYFEALQKPRGGLSVSLKAGLKIAVEKQQSALTAIGDDAAYATTADIVHILSTLTISVFHVRDSLSQLRTELIAEVEQAERKLAKPPDQAAITQLKKDVVRFAESLLQVADDPGLALDALPTQLIALDKAWRDGLMKQLGSKDPKAVEASLSTQDYPGAVAATAAALSGSAFLSVGSSSVSTWPSRLRPDFVAGPVACFRTSVFGLDLPRTTDRTPIPTSTQLFWDKSLQSFVLFVLVGLGGVMLYQSTFVGTFEDFSKVFFWAFGLDITLDAVRQATRPKSA